MNNRRNMGPAEYAELQEDNDERLDIFMRKYLRRQWPVCMIVILGIIQLALCLTILGIDLPIILMFAPRWQVFTGCWGFLFTFIASVSTLHSARRMTWSKLKWTAALNIIGGIAAALTVAFNVLYIANPKVCLVSAGCAYLSYTYTAAKSLYIGEFIVALFFLISVFVFLGIFIKYGVGGTQLYENIAPTWESSGFNPLVPPDSYGTAAQPIIHPVTGPGVAAAQRHAVPMQMPPNPAGPGMMMRGPPPPPNGMLRYPPPPPGGMMPRPRPPMVAGQRPIMQGYYRPPGPYSPPPVMPPYQD